MEQERKSLRIGIWVIACAAVFRLLGSGILQPVGAFLTQPEVASFLLYLETGRVARFQPPPPEEPVPLPSQPTEPEPVPAATQPCFSPSDASLVQVGNSTRYEPDVAAMLMQPLQWDLTDGAPAVLIIHSHATESYTPSPGASYEASSAYRTLDADYNMLSVGAHLAQLLEAGGIKVIHDRTLHDHPSYTAAYGNSRTAVAAYLEQYPSIRMVLDLHRDAADRESGQLTTAATVNGSPSSQLMMVVGTDAQGLRHPNWSRNMSLAIQLTALLEKTWPGLTRPISFRAQRFNQDLSPGALLVEVGAAGDTHPQALQAATALAEGILALAHGTATADSTD